MPNRRFALATTLAVSASLVLSVAPAALADEATPPPATSTKVANPRGAAKAPAAKESVQPNVRVVKPATTASKPATVKPKPKSKYQLAKEKALKVAKAALSRVKKGQYVRGRTGPTTFDCSGLMIWAYRQVGIKNLPRTSRAMSSATKFKKVSKKNLKPGDLIFYYSPVSHVAMYIGNGKIVHARNPRVDLDVQTLKSYPAPYRYARRVINW